ncbi:hypothetical protein [Marinobacter sp. OP 3.4]|uniref:hypothetical protein n=1 Tax=Marinobacter sp. OP 3.4 TaxID=3076501 RepID=UPI002E1CA821
MTLFLLPSLAFSDSGTSTGFEFSNFSESVSVQARGSRFFLNGDIVATLSGDLIVKTTPDSTEADVKEVSSSVTTARLLYSGQAFSYFLVSTTHPNLASAVDVLEGADGVLLVQPDILQLQTPSSLLAAPNFRGYLDRSGVASSRRESRGGGVSVAIF